MLHATAAWAQQLAAVAPSVVAVGCYGSYARGGAGVGSDIDVLVVRRDETPVPHLLGADVDALPVPADFLHYTETELGALLERGGRMARVVRDEAVWFVSLSSVLEHLEG